jgi:hypothetical protein
MTDSTRERLMRAFETLKKQHITPILVLTGSRGVFDWDVDHYVDLARAAGTPGSYIAASPGDEESGGVYWNLAGELHHSGYGAPVPALWWQFTTLPCAEALQQALQAEGLSAAWDGDRFTSVRTDLLRVPA